MHERFRFKNGEELKEKAKELGFSLPWSDDMSVLLEGIKVSNYNIPNRFAVQPMEGYDSLPDGSPSLLTHRRYTRYADGGSGLIWHEAVAIRNDGRSSPYQLCINKGNKGNFLSLTNMVREQAALSSVKPIQVIQLTHSGRYSKPDGKPAPLVPALNPVLDKGNPQVLSDKDLGILKDDYVKAVRLAVEAGYDIIDIKSCHGYLIHEMLSCRARTNSRYGGEETQARFRLMLEIIDGIRDEVPEAVLTTRLCIWDGWSGGFGMTQDYDTPDFSEPVMLIKELTSRGIAMLNISMGSPYYNPHIVRPYDTPVPGNSVPGEHPLKGVWRMIEGTKYISKQFPEIAIVGSAYSWLREYAPNVAAGLIQSGGASIAGFGRGAFAYPDMPKDISKYGKADKDKVCITCSGCSRLVKSMRHGGCVIRDREVYGEELKKLIADERAER